MGSFDKGDRLKRVIGLKRNTETDLPECKCEWHNRSEDPEVNDYPLQSYVPISVVKEKESQILLEYFEFTAKFYGSALLPMYPLYFPEEAAKYYKDKNDDDESDEEVMRRHRRIERKRALIDSDDLKGESNIRLGNT